MNDDRHATQLMFYDTAELGPASAPDNRTQLVVSVKGSDVGAFRAVGRLIITRAGRYGLHEILHCS